VKPRLPWSLLNPLRRDQLALAGILALVLAVPLLVALGFIVIPQKVTTAYFGIPYGAVWSNLVASVICVGIAYFRLRAQAARHHKQALAQAQAQHDEKMAQADRHHAAHQKLVIDLHTTAARQSSRQHAAVLQAVAAAPPGTVAPDDAVAADPAPE
jgi:hypothetical protein